MAATMPDLVCFRDLRSRDGPGETPAQRADGPSACPGSSLHERDKRQHQWRLLGHAASRKVHRVRNAGVVLLLWPAVFIDSLGRVLLNEHAAALCLDGVQGKGLPWVSTAFRHSRRRGRGEPPSVPHVPSLGKRTRDKRNDRRALEPDKPRGDDACLNLKPSPLGGAKRCLEGRGFRARRTSSAFILRDALLRSAPRDEGKC